MLCECINGPLAGWVVIRCYDDGAVEYGLCPECGGTLISSCCDAAGSQNEPSRDEQAQPEPKEST
jgi:hypothetical protein